MSALWNLKEIKKVFKPLGELHHFPNDWEATGISIDTRTLTEGDLFFALKGETNDGHLFLAQAIQKKAAAVVVDSVERVPEGVPTILVKDTHEALEVLAGESRDRTKAKIIAVTGSVGKTTTKELLKFLLSKYGKTYASPKSYNNSYGVPFSLASLPRDAEYGVFEVGMNHPGEIAPLSKLIRPEISVITAVEEAHIEFFESVHAIGLEKADICAGITGKKALVVNRDIVCFDEVTEYANKLGAESYTSFGMHRDATFRLESSVETENGSVVDYYYKKGIYNFELSIPGGHHVKNSLCALAVLSLLDIDLLEAAHYLKGFLPAERRGNKHNLSYKNITLVDESYNANPASMHAALNVLGVMGESNRRRVAVLGDMKELGDRGPALHAQLLDGIMMNEIGKVFACGELMKNLYEQLPEAIRGHYSDDINGLIIPVLNSLEENDIVMVKGSLSMEMKKLVDALIANEKVGEVS